MNTNNPSSLCTDAINVLKQNDRGSYTIPASGLYPHQWLWDSCFIAIGMRHYDIKRAQAEILHLLTGQWHNGMIPHVIFADKKNFSPDHNIWRSWLSPDAPNRVATSGITQPPMIAEAVVKIGKKLPIHERRSWYKTVFNPLLRYHQWLYDERDPHNEGLTLQIHPWETGLDNTPPWMHELHQHLLPWWIRGLKSSRLLWIGELLRRDTKYVPATQRLETVDALAFFSIQRRLRRKIYNTDQILPRADFTIEDLVFNSIFIRANEHLAAISKTINQPLPKDFIERTNKTREALNSLWEPYSGQYYSRNFVTHELIKIPSIATLLPLYSGSIPKEQASKLVHLMNDSHFFGSKFPVPTVPLNSPWFKQHTYWQGPVWINTNWLIIDGLIRYGFTDEAKLIKNKSIELMQNSGFSEYFSPLDGSAAGANNFSWSAALAIDMLS